MSSSNVPLYINSRVWINRCFKDPALRRFSWYLKIVVETTVDNTSKLKYPKGEGNPLVATSPKLKALVHKLLAEMNVAQELPAKDIAKAMSGLLLSSGISKSMLRGPLEDELCKLKVRLRTNKLFLRNNVAQNFSLGQVLLGICRYSYTRTCALSQYGSNAAQA